MRTLSAYKDERIAASQLYSNNIQALKGKKDPDIKKIKDALYFSIIISYAQGLAMLYKASSELHMEIPLHDVVKIWRGGCIIRSSLLEVFYKAFKNQHPRRGCNVIYNFSTGASNAPVATIPVTLFEGKILIRFYL